MESAMCDIEIGNKRRQHTNVVGLEVWRAHADRGAKSRRTDTRKVCLTCLSWGDKGGEIRSIIPMSFLTPRGH
jgi:hypothetical protein